MRANARVQECRSPQAAFRSRADAGRILAPLCAAALEGPLVGIGAGGVAVAQALAAGAGEIWCAAAAPVCAPWSAELVVGAVAFDGSVHLEEERVAELGLPARELAQQIESARLDLALEPVGSPPPRGHGPALVVGDGLQSVAELRATLAAVAALGYQPVSLALATAHWRDLRLLAPWCHRIFCGSAHRDLLFSAADAYAETPRSRAASAH